MGLAMFYPTLSAPRPSSLLFHACHYSSLPKPTIVSKTLIPTTLIPPEPLSTISFPLLIGKHYPSFQITRSSNNPSSSTEPYESPPTVIFIKGLPLSTSEGRLKEAFSEFGEVCKVKIVLDKNTKQSLGFAYVWYAIEESAQLAIKEMDGKFFDGRFIYATTARPGSCRTPRNATPYKF